MRSNRARIVRANLEQRQAERPPKAFTTSHMRSLSSTLTLPNDEKFDAKQSRTHPPRQPRATSAWTTSKGLHNVPHALTVFNFDSSERRKVWCEAVAHASSNLEQRQAERPPKAFTTSHMRSLSSTLTLPNDEKFGAKQSRTHPPRHPRATSG